MDIISAIASINAFIIAFLISRKQQKSISDKLLIAWIINFAFYFAIPFCIENLQFFHPSYWGMIMGIFIVAHAPFLYVYTSSFTNPEFKINFRNFYHFGIISIFVVSIIPYFSLSPEDRISIVLEKQDLSYYMLVPMLTQLLIRAYFLTRTFIILVRHQSAIGQSFSYKTKIDLSWIKLITYGFFGEIILNFVLYGLVSAQLVNIYWMDYIIVIINIILFFYIAYSGYKQRTIQLWIPQPAPVPDTKKKETNRNSNPESAKPVAEENYHPVISDLIQLMDKEKLYLEPELNIGDIANQLNIHAHQLSRLINQQLKKNFYEFVNAYRVQEFKRLATDPRNRHISILGLAMDAGFNSKATFYRFFKNTTGLTPSQFMENYKF